jgi:gas vesicle protein
MISAFFTGALLGTGLALLFAPVTGKEARNTIAHQFEELKEKIKKLEKKLHKADSITISEAADEEEIGV